MQCMYQRPSRRGGGLSYRRSRTREARTKKGEGDVIVGDRRPTKALWRFPLFRFRPRPPSFPLRFRPTALLQLSTTYGAMSTTSKLASQIQVRLAQSRRNSESATHYDIYCRQRIATAWPADPLRPHLQLKNFFTALEKHPSLTPQALNAAQTLLENGVTRKVRHPFLGRVSGCSLVKFSIRFQIRCSNPHHNRTTTNV